MLHLAVALGVIAACLVTSGCSLYVLFLSPESVRETQDRLRREMAAAEATKSRSLEESW